VFSYYGMKYGRVGEWVGLLGGLTGCGLIAMVSMFAAMCVVIPKNDRT
jgi:hypothetical protein